MYCSDSERHRSRTSVVSAPVCWASLRSGKPALGAPSGRNKGKSFQVAGPRPPSKREKCRAPFVSPPARLTAFGGSRVFPRGVRCNLDPCWEFFSTQAKSEGFGLCPNASGHRRCGTAFRVAASRVRSRVRPWEAGGSTGEKLRCPAAPAAAGRLCRPPPAFSSDDRSGLSASGRLL